MTTSEAIDKIAPAIALAQAAFVAPKRTHEVKLEKYSYKYAPLDEVVAALRKPLGEMGLSFVQTVETFEAAHGMMVGVETTILHASGQWIACGMVRLPAGSTCQQYGGALSFARRYSLLAAFGLAAEDDDAQGVEATPEPRAKWSEQKPDRDPRALPAPPSLRMPPPPGGEPALAEPDFGPDPDLLADMQAVYQLPNGTPAQKLRLGPSKNSPAISEAQAKRLFAIVRGQGLSAPEYRDWLLAVSGYSSDKDIPKAHYEPICIAAALIGKKETDAF